MNWFQHRFCSFVVLTSRRMFQQESGHGIMRAHNNADAVVGFILILILRMDLTESSHSSKCKACHNQFPREFFSFFFVHVKPLGFLELVLWFLGLCCVTNCCTPWQMSLWTTAWAHVVTFVWCSFLCEADIIRFQCNICLNTLTWFVNQCRHSFTSIWVYASPSLVPFPSVPNSLTGNVQKI